MVRKALEGKEDEKEEVGKIAGGEDDKVGKEIGEEEEIEEKEEELCGLLFFQCTRKNLVNGEELGVMDGGWCKRWPWLYGQGVRERGWL